MIVTHLSGGLGNQMFQYSLGLRVALINDVPLKLDISGCMPGSPRSYRLDHFNISAEIAVEADVTRFLGKFRSGLLKRVSRALRRRIPIRISNCKQRVITERQKSFDQNILKAPADVYLDGYWQTEKYFNDIERTLKSEFQVIDPPDETNLLMLDRISQTTSVSVHVRRGDYLLPAYHKTHGTCSLAYYRAAIDAVARSVDEPHFFVFSDDVEWTRDNLRTDYCITYVDHNGEDKDYEDLRLMSSCKHHIIANSTFSWWAAWLATNPEKIVIAPNKWFHDPSFDTTDLIPDSWRKM